MQADIFDRESGVPIYHQLATHIKKQIASGVYRPGDVLPSEADYIRELGLSRTTVRLAFGVITNAGLVRREQGRGTIVLSQVHSSLPHLTSFTEEVRRYNRNPGVELVSITEEAIPSEVAIALSLLPGTVVTKVVRLRTADNEPIGLADSWLNTVRFPALKSMDFKVLSLYDAFEKEQGLTIRSAVENIRADLPSDFEARKLKIKPGSPVIRMMRTTFVRGEQDKPVPIEYASAIFNGAVYSVDVELYRKSNP
jgi:GntR family transcriptional regulator